MSNRPMVFLDIETTGMAPISSRVLEIGALRVEDGKIVAHIKQLIDPEEPVPPEITRLTGIEPHETKGMPVFAGIAPQLDELLHDALFVAHNVDFDYSFLKMEYERLGSPFGYDKLCTVRLSRALYPHYRSHKLDQLIARHGYQVSARHRAFDDAEVLYKFFTDCQTKFGAEALTKHAKRLTIRTRNPMPPRPGSDPVYEQTRLL